MAGSILTAPPGFGGTFHTDPATLRSRAGASGPFWRIPAAVALPRHRDDVVALVRWAADRGVALVPRGAGTGMPGGNVGPDVVVDLTGLDTLGAVEPGDGGAPASVRAGAGCVAEGVRDRVQAAGLELPALPSSAPWCTVGGMAACNAAGARSFRLGAARSWIRSVEWVRVDGTVETLRRGGGNPGDWSGLRDEILGTVPDPLPWPPVRKNSSGYALDAWLSSGDALDLAVGSEGTLGIVTAVELVPTPPPPAVRVAVVGIPELDRLPGLAGAARELATARACEYLGRQLVDYGRLARRAELEGVRVDAGLVLVELAGDPGPVEADTVRLDELAGHGGMRVAGSDAEARALWTLRHAASPSLARALEEGRRSTQFIEDGVVPVDALPAYIRGLEEIMARHETGFVLFGHAGDGNLHVNPLLDLSRDDWKARTRDILLEVVALVAELGGTLAGEHGDGRLRTPFLDRFFHPDVIRAFAEVKGAMDPDGILNPGVVVPDGTHPDPLAGLGEAPGFASGSQGPERGHR